MTTLKEISDKIALDFESQKIIAQDRMPIYSYGVELILSALIGLSGVLVIAAILNDLPECLMFLLAFIPLRLWAGGYHASSHLTCFLCFSFMYLCAFSLSLVIPMYYLSFTIMSSSLISTLIIILFAPVAHPNKRLTAEKAERNRRRSLIFTITILAFASLLIFYRVAIPTWVLRFFLGEFFAASSLVAGLIKNNRGNTNEKNQSAHVQI